MPHMHRLVCFQLTFVKLFMGNVEVYLQLITFLHTDMTQTAEFRSQHDKG